LYFEFLKAIHSAATDLTDFITVKITLARLSHVFLTLYTSLSLLSAQKIDQAVFGQSPKVGELPHCFRLGTPPTDYLFGYSICT